MVMMVASASILSMLLTMLCCSRLILKEKTKKEQIKWIRGETMYWDEELEKSFYHRFLYPAFQKLMKQLSKVSKGKGKSAEKSRERNMKLENELRLAGIRLNAQEFSFLRIFVMFLIFAAAAAVTLLSSMDMQLKLLLGLFAVIASILAPRYYLKSRIKSRQLAIQNQMPNIMDVLSVSIEAGLAFDAALLKVIERFKGPLVEEFRQVYKEVQMGQPRREALAALNKRSNVPELQTFASAVVQSEQFGTPMKNVLRAQAQQLRVNRRQQAQEKGMKAPIRMMLPMVLFIFPVIFIILLGPTLIQVLKG